MFDSGTDRLDSHSDMLYISLKTLLSAQFQPWKRSLPTSSALLKLFAVIEQATTPTISERHARVQFGMSPSLQLTRLPERFLDSRWSVS